jgi:hypothetical protein
VAHFERALEVDEAMGAPLLVAHTQHDFGADTPSLDGYVGGTGADGPQSVVA